MIETFRARRQPVRPAIGSIWWEDDTRWPAEKRRVEVLEFLPEARVLVQRASGLKTKIRLNRFGMPGGYREHP